MAEKEPSLPDIDKPGWLEAKNLKKEHRDKYGNLISASRFYIRFNQKHKENCWIVSFLGFEKVALMWTQLEIEYSAILLDQKTNSWAIGKPGKEWDGEIDYDGKNKPVGIKLSLETDNGIKSAYFHNPKASQ